MPSPHDTNERRQAIWPWLLMPLLVLLVAYTLYNFKQTAKSSAPARAQAEETSGP